MLKKRIKANEQRQNRFIITNKDIKYGITHALSLFVTRYLFLSMPISSQSIVTGSHYQAFRYLYWFDIANDNDYYYATLQAELLTSQALLEFL